MTIKTDYLVVGTGLAGLAFALKMAKHGDVTILSKTKSDQTNTNWAQGGIAAVFDESDSFDKHIQDTLDAGGGLCREDIVRNVIEQAPERIQDLIDWGVKFDLQEDHKSIDLTREGGHSKRRILHVKDYTGAAIQKSLLHTISKHPNIKILENHFAIDLLVDRKTNPLLTTPPRCIGAYIFDNDKKQVLQILAKATCLASGGAGKTYLYTSNWEGATGDGIAMAYRAGCRVTNLEMMQFHPTCLYHPDARNFLITEAIRGEGGELITHKGEKFMTKYHKLGSLAPRDAVALAIDSEIKLSGRECVYIDITHKPKEYLMERFPVIYQKCAEYGIFMDKDPIPVVPAAHYLCGGVHIDRHGKTDLNALFAIGETSCSGLHGANRLASNSLLECLAFAHNSSEYIISHKDEFPMTELEPADWKDSHNEDKDEMVMITHMWEEIRRLMWNYVGIVRSNKRLERAEHRLDNLMSEVKEYYWNFKMHTDILELRNLALVASLTVKSALKRKESRGVHYNLDYPKQQSKAKDTII
ncbi:MAG: L-aspartate oxidase [Bdellovibrionota bacterium]